MKRLNLGIISIDGRLIFAKDGFASGEFTDVYKTEHNLNEYVLSVSYSNPPTPVFQLFRQYTNEDKRLLRDRLFETSNFLKIEKYIKQYLL